MATTAGEEGWKHSAAQRSPAAALGAGSALVVSLLLLYLPVLKGMVGTWWTNENASHGFVVPFVALAAAWRRLEAVQGSGRIWPWGLGVSALGVLLYGAGVVSAVEFLPEVSLLVVVGGVMLYLLGPVASRPLAFPYAFLWFMVPWPDTLVEVASFPMQLFSAKFATMVVGLAGIPVSRDGVDIHLSRYTFSVAARCSGMKSLVALLAVGAVAAFLSGGPVWRRWGLFASALPLAMLANVARILCILGIGERWGARAAEGFLHGLAGMVMVYVFAAVGLAAVARLLGLRYGSEAGGPRSGGGGAPGGSAGRLPAIWGGGLPGWRAFAAPLIVVALGAGLVLAAREATADSAAVPADFGRVPMQMGNWRGEDAGPLDETSQEMLHPDAYMGRLYTREDGYPVEIVAVVGRAKETFHSPGFCLLGGGWNIIRKGRRQLEVGRDGSVTVNEFWLQRRDEQRLVFYWYASHEEMTPSWVVFQYRLLRNRLVRRPAGGMLVRVTAPAAMGDDAGAEAAGELIRALWGDLRAAVAL